MKTINKRLIGLIILSVFQLIFPLLFIAAKEKVIEEGKEYLFRIQPVDPYDFFQGKYVELNVQPLFYDTKNSADFKKNDIVYVEFIQDSLGARINRVSKEKTLNSLKLKIYSDPSAHKTLLFKLPFKRFCLEEYKAKNVELKLARSNSKRNFVHVKILNGEFVITDITSDGKSLVIEK